MVRNPGIWLLLVAFLFSIFPFKNAISTKSTFSDRNVLGDVSLPFFWGPEEKRDLWDMSTVIQLETHLNLTCKAL